MSLRNSNKGFTIIELLIVIVVIGILAALVLNAFGNIQERARDTERQNDINAIHTQLELYYTDNNAYPNVAAATDLDAVITSLNEAATVAPNGPTETYTYTPADDGVLPTSCAAVGTHDCDEYDLSATLEADGTTFSRDSVN